MSALPWIIAGGVVVVGGAAVIAIRNERAKQPDAGLCESMQPLTAAFGFYIPPQACGPINALAAGILAGTESAKDAKNKELNGEVDIALDAATKSIAVKYIPPHQNLGTTVGTFGQRTGRIEPMLKGTVLRFKNGGVPFKQHPDFAKCAPGTNDMSGQSGATAYILATPGRAPNQFETMDSDKLAGFFRGEARYFEMLTGGNGDPTTSKALGIVAGKKWACPAGQVITSITKVTDHRNEVAGHTIQVICGPVGSVGVAPPPPMAGSGTQIPLGPSPGPNYEWVPPVGSAAGYWRRKRAA